MGVLVGVRVGVAVGVCVGEWVGVGGFDGVDGAAPAEPERLNDLEN